MLIYGVLLSTLAYMTMIPQILHKPDLAGRMMSWAIDLTQYDTSYEPWLAIKAQVLADFLA
jgi:hypothetical protein